MKNNKQEEFVAGDWVYPPIKPCCTIYTTPQQIEEVDSNRLCKIGNDWFVPKSLQFAFKNGEEVEVLCGGISWNKRTFISINPNATLSYSNRYIAVNSAGGVSTWKKIRPITPKPTTINFMGNDISIESAKTISEGLNKQLKEVE